MSRLAYLGLFATAGSSAFVQKAGYSFDCSFPIHDVELGCDELLGNRTKVYEDYMEGCRSKYSTAKDDVCDINEHSRLEMNTLQPSSMVNYTETGYSLVKTPAELMDLITAFWEANKEDKIEELWGKGNIYSNHWESPSYLVHLGAESLGGGDELKNRIWETARPTLEEWTGQKLAPTSLYGIRMYTRGAILSPHVDRLPLVSSAIINVAQEVDEPWVLEIYDRHDEAVHITMEPGDMVLYESGSLTHGRPFELKGEYFANVFIHFEPIGESILDKEENDGSDNDSSSEDGDEEEEEEDEQEEEEEDEDDYDADFYPPYLLLNSTWAKVWEESNPDGWEPSDLGDRMKNQRISSSNTFSPHSLAALGDLERLKSLQKDHKSSLFNRDANGWQPIHEAARSGHVDVVTWLIEQGADMNSRAGPDGNSGLSVLKLAVDFHQLGHPLVTKLITLGARSISNSSSR